MLSHQLCYSAGFVTTDLEEWKRKGGVFSLHVSSSKKQGRF